MKWFSKTVIPPLPGFLLFSNFDLCCFKNSLPHPRKQVPHVHEGAFFQPGIKTKSTWIITLDYSTGSHVHK